MPNPAHVEKVAAVFRFQKSLAVFCCMFLQDVQVCVGVDGVEAGG